MNTSFRFPFGEPVSRLEQQDRTPKRFFVLGVYASAVHTRSCTELVLCGEQDDWSTTGWHVQPIHTFASFCLAVLRQILLT
jgi:hypothetical protein